MQWVLHSNTSHLRITEKHEQKEWAITHSSLPRISEDDLPGTAKSRKMTYWGLAHFGLRQAGISQAPVSHLPWMVASESQFAKSQKWIGETSCLNSSSGDKRFRLVISWNCPCPGKSSSRDWKTAESDFGWTKSSQKSLSCWKWFYAPLVRLYH